MEYLRLNLGRDEGGASGSGSFVYFAGVFGGPIKIGYSRNPRQRLAELRVGSDLDLQLFATIPGGASLEATLKKQFAPHRIRGEFYVATPQLLMLIWDAAAGGASRYAFQPTDLAASQRFMKERARRAIGCRLRSSVLYNAYTSWCSENGEAAASQKAFSGSLAAAGYRKVKSNGIFWTDLQLVRVLDA